MKLSILKGEGPGGLPKTPPSKLTSSKAQRLHVPVTSRGSSHSLTSRTCPRHGLLGTLSPEGPAGGFKTSRTFFDAGLLGWSFAPRSSSWAALGNSLPWAVCWGAMRAS